MRRVIKRDRYSFIINLWGKNVFIGAIGCIKSSTCPVQDNEIVERLGNGEDFERIESFQCQQIAS